MKILPIRSIENDTYTTVIKPSEFGTASVTAENELAMLADTPQMLRYADIEFKDKFIVSDGLPVVSTEANAVEVNLDLNNKEFMLDENFEVSLSIDAKKILDSELDGTVFTDKHVLAQAKTILFETKVIARIKELLEIARSHVNSFEETIEQTL